MTEIFIPFLKEFEHQLRNGDKVATTRTKRYGQKGDTFTIYGTRFKLMQVIPTPLKTVADYFYRPEGFDTPQAFIQVWNRIHPRKRYVPEQTVYLHIFCRLGESLSKPHNHLLIAPRDERGLPEPQRRPTK